MTQQLADMGLFLIRSLDASKKQLTSIDKKGDKWEAQYKDGQKLSVIITEQIREEQLVDGFIITLNSKENVEFVYAKWQLASIAPKLTIIFLDPQTGNKWLLKPFVHAKIAEPSTLRQGLITLYEHSVGKQ